MVQSKGTINFGHGEKSDGTFDPGSVGQTGLKESDVVKAVGTIVVSELKRLGHDINFIQSGDLWAVVDSSNNFKSEWFVSIHNNSYTDKSAHGIETHISALGSNAEKLARAIQSNLINDIKLTDRGIKVSGLYVNKYTNCPSCLVELPFISNSTEEALLANPDFQRKCAISIVKGIQQYLGLEYVKEQSNQKTPILGAESITVEQCNQFIRKVNPNAINIAQYYKKYGELLGIKWGYAFSQMVKETNYLRFGGDVVLAKNNYCGLGTIGGGVKGVYFDSPELGVLAHMEHLYAYCCKDSLPSNLPKIDPRFDLVTRGIAPNWEDLNGRWAVPGIGYGEDICKIYNQICKETVKDVQPVPIIVTPVVPPSIPSPSLIFTYPNNAKIINDDLYIRDINGVQIPNRYVSKGDNITVLEIVYDKQLVLLEYPTSSGVKTGYVKNIVNCFSYYYQGAFKNGSTPESTYNDNNIAFGNLDPYEQATPLYRKNGFLKIMYNTSKGQKTGFTHWSGGFDKF